MAEREKREKIWIFEREYTRRDVLKSAGAAGAAAGLAGILAACGGDEEAAAPPAEPAAPPPAEPAPPANRSAGRAGRSARPAGQRGQDRRPAARRPRRRRRGGGLQPGVGSSFIDASRYYNLYDPLTRVNPDFSSARARARVEPERRLDRVGDQAAARRRLARRQAVHRRRRHLHAQADGGRGAHLARERREHPPRRAEQGRRPHARDPAQEPERAAVDSFVQQNTVIIQDGATDFTNPVGTGPFKFQSFTAGQRSLCVRNPNYWDEGKPYVDEWEDISIDDDAARLNALLAGEIDMMSQLAFTQAKAQLETGEIQVDRRAEPGHPGLPTWPSTCRRSTTRRAAGLPADPRPAGADRPRAAGFGTLGNDLVGKGLPFFADLAPREQDLEQAKALLAQAGKENLEVTLHTSDIVPGFVEAATLFAEQAKGAGVTVNVKKEAANAYFDTSALHEARLRPVVLDGLLARHLVRAGAALRRGLERDPLARPRVRRADPRGAGRARRGTAIELWREVQQIQYNEGGYIVWANLEHRRRRGEPRAGHRAERVLQPRRLELPGRLARQVMDRHAGSNTMRRT